ncbi:MAG: hypothetical protein IKQ44_12390 [Lachnospiraceae bacterium]|nr:hypothetical protein [Lachnospiraceae bacterium]
MAELSIKTIIDAGKKSLEDKNYWSALIVALTIPSMCSRIEYADEKYKGSNRNDENGIWYEDNRGIVHWHDKKAYVKWCNEWVSWGSRSTIGGKLVKNEYQKDRCLVSILGENYAEKFYEMRCNILHQGETDIEHGLGLPIFFSIGIENTILSNERIVQIETICDELFRYAESWVKICHCHDLPKRQYYDGNDRDDRLLYKRLCDDSRADYLLEQHNKELERRSCQ